MKKFPALLLALVLAFSLVACGNTEPSVESPTEPAVSSPDVSESVSQSPEPEVSEPVETVTAAASLVEITAENLSMSDAFVTEMTVVVDGTEMKVTAYEDCYVTNPTHYVQKDYLPALDQIISIYIPEGADENSPIIFLVNNSGWTVNSYSTATKVADGKSYVSDSDTDHVGYALSRNYVIVSYGARSRGDKTGDEYLVHAPATITDTKAVIRYLRYNADLLPAGDPEKIVISGTSGGGALSVIVASSGNSADYFESLYEIGAAGVEKVGDEYVSTISDTVFGTIAYCPINDLRQADAAYEFTYNATRYRILAENIIAKDSTQTPFQFAPPEDYTYDDLMAASDALAQEYGAYVESLGLLTAEGEVLNGDNLRAEIIKLLEEEIAETIAQDGAEKMLTDLDTPLTGKTSVYLISSEGWKDWVVINDDGTFTFDYDEYLFWLSRNSALKMAPSFSNEGMSSTGAGLSGQNEDTLYGSTEYAYSAFSAYSWNNDRVAGNGCGLDDTGMTFEEYLASEEGALLSLQLRMTSPIPYLTSEDGESAPYWYVRHGMADRDTSFALQTVLYHAMRNDETIRDVNFSFDWLYTHMGNYDVQEAYGWLESVLNAN